MPAAQSFGLRGQWPGVRRLAPRAVVFWCAVPIWITSLNVIRGLGYHLRELPGDVLMAAVHICLGLTGHVAAQAARRLPPGLREGAWTLIVVGSAAASITIGYGLSELGLLSLPRKPWALHQWAWQIGYWLVPFALWLTLAQILEQGRAVRERDARLSAAQVAAQEAEVRALHYQVNPHFLHNALDSLAVLVRDERTIEADRMILQLADFYRANLTTDPLKHVRLEDELARQGLYLQIEQARFAERLRVEVVCPPELADAEAPALILQPLVESAVRHAAAEGDRDVFIRIAAERAGPGRLRLDVSHSGVGFPDAVPTEIGVQNVRDRLHLLYGADARLLTRQDLDSHTASVVLPLRAQARPSVAGR